MNKKEKIETLTSSNEGVEESPGNMMVSLDGSTLALFGEEARGSQVESNARRLVEEAKFPPHHAEFRTQLKYVTYSFEQPRQ